MSIIPRINGPYGPGEPALDSGPEYGPMIDAWRLELQYGELVLLKLLGYEGRFGGRLHMRGRSVGQVEPVPWAR